MIILISGPSHSGKTTLAQKILEKYKFPYLSLDHLKMGLIRSHQTTLTPNDDDLLTNYLWPITKEIINTAIENKQNLTIEGCYIPYDWQKDFSDKNLNNIKYVCLYMTKNYIMNHYQDILNYASIIEDRIDEDYCTIEYLIKENEKVRLACNKYHLNTICIDTKYNVDFTININKK